jgi:SAM-dependent methyltransferase
MGENHDDSIDSNDALHEYWKNPDDDIDQPEKQLEFDATSEFLLELAESRIDESARVLELGCNVGRNLHYFHQSGFRDLVGIEISGEALDLLEETYPSLAADADLHHGAAEDVLPELPDDSVDLTFTMAVLAHIHPDSEFVFDEIVRVTADYLVTLENEETTSYKQVPRDYGEVFTDRGCEQAAVVGGEEVARRTEQRDAYRARVFRT